MHFRKNLRVLFGLILILVGLLIFVVLLDGIQSNYAMGAISTFFSDMQIRLNYGISGFSSFNEFDLTRIHFVVFFTLGFPLSILFFVLGGTLLLSRNGKKKIFLGILIIVLIYLVFVCWYRYQLRKYMNNYSGRNDTVNYSSN